MSSITDHLIYLLAWLSFGLAHSFLAGQRLQNLCGRYARLTYNVVALFHLWALFVLGNLVLDSIQPVFVDMPWLRSLYVMGWGLFLVALTQYDLGLLSGLKQIRRGEEAPQDETKLHLSGLHRFMRHPFYTAAFLILWGRIDDELDLATALWGSLYLLVGTFYEERRLVAQFGQAYIEYRQSVPAYLPWKIPRND